MKEIQTDDYLVSFDPDSSTAIIRGFLRLEGMEEYRPIMEFLLTAVEESSQFTLNLRDLEFLNSSGISMLSMFVLKIREKGGVKLVLQGSNKVLWQTKSLKNLQRLMPSLTLEFT
ncbi:MAG: hypothetical protein SFW36_03675 [Leptolyngbyaceae cyanobacterium bins.59]|nr:hypothetical protein [Leptolyngbyaceae cyanobacterium bins.59]